MLSQATASLEYHWFECMSTTFLFFFHFTSIFVFSPALYTQYTPILYCFWELLPRLLLVTSNSCPFSIAFWSFCLASCLLRPTHTFSLLLFGPFASSPACYVQLVPFFYCFLDLLSRLLLVTSNSLLLSNAFWTFCLASCLLRPIHSYYLMIFGPFNTSPACYTQHLCYSQDLPI